jgi:hypothetical protein
MIDKIEVLNGIFIYKVIYDGNYSKQSKSNKLL